MWIQSARLYCNLWHFCMTTTLLEQCIRRQLFHRNDCVQIKKEKKKKDQMMPQQFVLYYRLQVTGGYVFDLLETQWINEPRVKWIKSQEQPRCVLIQTSSINLKAFTKSGEWHRNFCTELLNFLHKAFTFLSWTVSYSAFTYVIIMFFYIMNYVFGQVWGLVG